MDNNEHKCEDEFCELYAPEPEVPAAEEAPPVISCSVTMTLPPRGAGNG